MKKMNSMAILLSACLVFSGCGMTNTAKGGMIGGGSGAALGAIIGGVVGHGKGAAIGAAVGAAVGTGVKGPDSSGGSVLQCCFSNLYCQYIRRWLRPCPCSG